MEPERRAEEPGAETRLQTVSFRTSDPMLCVCVCMCESVCGLGEAIFLGTHFFL